MFTIFREFFDCTFLDNSITTVGGNKQAVQKYIQNQEKEDLISNQISMVEYYDPFQKWLESNLKKKDKTKK